MKPFISFVIPIYNRPDELRQLLSSLGKQVSIDFEVIVVEDGSLLTSDAVCKEYENILNIRYITQVNTGPGLARNRGVEYAKGDWFIFLDSDCLIPEGYLSVVMEAIQTGEFDCFGGPDKAHQRFTPIQRAIGYSMSSVLTTGGIRGGKKKLDIFYPRSFNLGVKREAFEAIKGFSSMKYGEDLDFSMRLIESGFKTKLLIDAFVYHERRNTFGSFYRQVSHFGAARIHLQRLHPGSLKVVHTFPAAFVLGHLLLFLLSIFYPIVLLLLLIVPSVVFIDSLIQNKNIEVAGLSIIASYVQMFAYGIGFLKALF